jgi:hypothetical protein
MNILTGLGKDVARAHDNKIFIASYGHSALALQALTNNSLCPMPHRLPRLPKTRMLHHRSVSTTNVEIARVLYCLRA